MLLKGSPLLKALIMSKIEIPQLGESKSIYNHSRVKILLTSIIKPTNPSITKATMA
jgi:hypothetical protein